jgi:NAD+ kinase
VKYAETVGRWIKSKGLTVCVEDSNAKDLPEFEVLSELVAKKNVDCASTIVDFVVTMGGDGTVLYCASLFKHSVPPIISFNLGSLGFLTRQQLPNFRNDISALLNGEMFLVLRSRLCCRLLKNGREGWFVAAEHQVMNEIVIDKVKNYLFPFFSFFFSFPFFC